MKYILAASLAFSSIGYSADHSYFSKQHEKHNEESQSHMLPLINSFLETVEATAKAKGFSSALDLLNNNDFEKALDLLDVIKNTTIENFNENSEQIFEAIHHGILNQENATAFFEEIIDFTHEVDFVDNIDYSFFSFDHLYSIINRNTTKTVTKVKNVVEKKKIDPESMEEIKEIIRKQLFDGKTANSKTIEEAKKSVLERAEKSAHKGATFLCVASAVSLAYDIVDMVDVAYQISNAKILQEGSQQKLDTLIKDISEFKAEIDQFSNQLLSFMKKNKVASEKKKIKVVETCFDYIARFGCFEKRYADILNSLSEQEKNLIEKRWGSIKRLFSNAFFVANHVANLYNPYISKTMRTVTKGFAWACSGVGIYSGYQGYCSHQELTKVSACKNKINISSEDFARVAANQIKNLNNIKKRFCEDNDSDNDSDLGF